MKRIVNILSNKKLQLAIYFVVVCTFSAMAQLGDPGGGGSGDPDVPIDGGLSLLVAAGVGYGAKQLQKKKTNMQKTK
jgi:hypothetical protein